MYVCFENFPVERNVPFELLPKISGFSVQMVSGSVQILKTEIMFS